MVASLSAWDGVAAGRGGTGSFNGNGASVRVSKPVVAVSAVTLLAGFAAGVVVGRGSVPRVVAVAPVGAPDIAVAPAPPPLPVPDAPAGAEALDAALTDWFTSPGRRELALELLVDPMAGPFVGPRPTLRRAFVYPYNVPKSYAPRIPGVEAALRLSASEQGSQPVAAGELTVQVERLGARPDGDVEVEFIQANHGYACRVVVYLVRKGPAGWDAQLVSSD